MRHQIDWDTKDGNSICLLCDRCSPLECGYIDRGITPDEAIRYGNKIFTCPNLVTKGEKIDDYSSYVAEAYMQLVNTVRSQKAEMYKLQRYITVGKKLARACEEFMSAFGGKGGKEK